MKNKMGKKRNVIGIVLVLFIGVVAWSMLSAQSKVKYKHFGIAEYEKGNFQEAIDYYNKGIADNSDDACLFNNRGLVYYTLEQYDNAVRDYTTAIELRPDFTDAYCNRGLALFRKGSSYNVEPRKKAIADFTRAIELNPDFTDAFYNRAVTYTEQIHYLHKYSTIPPKFPSEEMDNYNKALADYNKALYLDPSYVLAYQGRGNLFYRHGDWDLADKEYDKALNQEGEILKKVGYEGLGGVYNSRGRNYLAWGKLEEAISVFTKAVEYYRKGIVNEEVGLCKSVTNALAHRKVAAWELGRWEDTIKYADESIKVKTSNPKKYGKATHDYFVKGKCYYNLGRYKEAVNNLKKVLSESKYGVDAEARLYLGRIYKKKGDKQKAEKEIRKALKIYDKDVRKGGNKLYKAYFRRGVCYIELDEYDKAISDLEETIKWKVFADKPANHANYWLDAHKFIGVAYMKAQNKNKAEEYLKNTIELAKERGFEEVVEEVRDLLSKL